MDLGVKYILEAGARAECDVEINIKALVIYHHFMRCIDSVPYDQAMVAASSLHLSSKIREREIDIDELIFLFYQMVNGNTDNFYPEGMKFKILKKSLITVEFIMQRMIEFTLNYSIAHQYLVPFLRILQERANNLDTFFERMSITCMKLMSDFYLNRMCLNYKPEDIAVACIDTALRVHGFAPYFKAVEPWYKGFCIDLSERRIHEMQVYLSELYFSNTKKVRPCEDFEDILSDEDF